METVVFMLKSESYVKQGAFGKGAEEFAETFIGIGGISAGIQPSWAFGLPAGEFMVMVVVGSPEAIAFTESMVVA